MVEILNYVAAIVAASLVNTAAVTCIGVGLALLVARHKQWSAASRYGLCWIMLVFVIAAPVVSALLPVKREVRAATKVAHHAAVIRSLAPLVRTVDIRPATPPPAGLSADAILLLGWAAVSALQFMVLVRGFFYGLRLKRQAKPAGDHLMSLFDMLRKQSAVWRPVTLGISEEVEIPAVVGYWKPLVVIPAALEGRLGASELEQVMLHELAHVARFDDWGIALQRVIEAAGVFHPLVRYLGYRLSRDREMACDDRVTAFYEPKQYAACLAKVADIGAFAPASALAVPLLERKSELLDRVEMLLDKSRTHVPRMSAWRVCLAMAGLIVLGAVGLRVPRLMALPVQVTPHGKPAEVIEQKLKLDEAQARLQAAKQHLADVRTVYGSNDAKYREAERQEEEAEIQSELISDGQLDAAAAEKMSRAMQELKATVDELNAKTPKNVSDVQGQLMELQTRLAEMQAELGATNEKLEERLALAEKVAAEINSPDYQKQLADLDARMAKVPSDAQMAQIAKMMAEFEARQAEAEKRAEKRLKELLRQAQKQSLEQQVH